MLTEQLLSGADVGLCHPDSQWEEFPGAQRPPCLPCLAAGPLALCTALSRGDASSGPVHL